MLVIVLVMDANNTIDTEALIREMRAAGRNELIHYAGAAYRDSVAAEMCRQYVADRGATEQVLKSRALKVAWGVDVAPENVTPTPIAA